MGTKSHGGFLLQLGSMGWMHELKERARKERGVTSISGSGNCRDIFYEGGVSKLVTILTIYPHITEMYR